MSLFSTSNITCNERSSVGRNFRDTINESSSPINRFTEKPDTRSFDEIFYEADIAIREASNSMNKLWYKSVLESDTVESAIINEANIFSKMIEVIKTIFDAIKKAISSWVKKARTLLQKIFKKKPADKPDSKGTSKDSENTEKVSKTDVRSTDKESTPTDKVEEIKSKKDELEREKKELQSKLKEAKKNEEKKKKDESQSGNSKDKKANSSDDSISTSNIDTSSLDTSNKKNQSDKMDTISVPEKELEKKIEETEDKLKKVSDELKTAEKETMKTTQSKMSSQSASSQDKMNTESSSSNNEVSVLYNKYMSDIEGNLMEIDSLLRKYRKAVKNSPKITPYIDLFKIETDKSEKIDMNKVFTSAFSALQYTTKTETYDFFNAVYITTRFLSGDDDSKIKADVCRTVEGDDYNVNGFKKYLNAKTTISDRDKNLIIAGFVDNVRFHEGLGHSYVSSEQLEKSMTSLDSFKNAIKGGKINTKDFSVSEPVDISISELEDIQMIYFVNNMMHIKKNNGNSGILKSIEDGLKSIDSAKDMFTRRANFIMNTIKNRIQELSRNCDTDTCQYFYNEFTPVIQKTITESISSVASLINQVFSTRIQLYTEACTKGNTWFDSCLKLCIAAKLADENKK